MKSKGISTGIHYPIALPNLKAYLYLNHNGNDFPEATKASQEILSLPMFPELDGVLKREKFSKKLEGKKYTVDEAVAKIA